MNAFSLAPSHALSFSLFLYRVNIASPNPSLATRRNGVMTGNVGTVPPASEPRAEVRCRCERVNLAMTPKTTKIAATVTANAYDVGIPRKTKEP